VTARPAANTPASPLPDVAWVASVQDGVDHPAAGHVSIAGIRIPGRHEGLPKMMTQVAVAGQGRGGAVASIAA